MDNLLDLIFESGGEIGMNLIETCEDYFTATTKKPLEEMRDSLYACAYVCENSVKEILSRVKAARADGFDPSVLDMDGEKYHCTVMYSRTVGIDAILLEELLSRVFFYGEMRAQVKHMEYWEGHKKDGVLVIEMVSQDMCDLHQLLKDNGLKHSFEDYCAHVTVGYKVGEFTEGMRKFVDNFNRDVNANPLTVFFDSMSADAIKKP